MKFQNLEARMVVLFFCLAASITGAPAQMKRDSAETNKREQALRLFDQDKRLEALPLLEELAQKNPNDEAIEVCLAGSLVTHAATLTDQHAAAAERLRAESILEKSGSNNTLAKNLLQLLREMPDGADTQFSANPAVEQAMRAGEAAFSRRDYDEAIQNCMAASGHVGPEPPPGIWARIAAIATRTSCSTRPSANLASSRFSLAASRR